MHFVTQANICPISNHFTGDLKGSRGTGCHKKHFSLNTDKLFSSPRTVITWGERGMCVRGRDPYTGTDLEMAWTIDGIKLPVKERNQYVFKGEAGRLWCMRVGFIDTARCVRRSWKRTITWIRSTYPTNLDTQEKTAHVRVCICIIPVWVPLLQRYSVQCLTSTQATKKENQSFLQEGSCARLGWERKNERAEWAVTAFENELLGGRHHDAISLGIAQGGSSARDGVGWRPRRAKEKNKTNEDRKGFFNSIETMLITTKDNTSCSLSHSCRLPSQSYTLNNLLLTRHLGQRVWPDCNTHGPQIPALIPTQWWERNLNLQGQGGWCGMQNTARTENSKLLQIHVE